MCEHDESLLAIDGERGDGRGWVTGGDGQEYFSRKIMLAARGGVLGGAVTAKDEEQDDSFRSEEILSFRSVSLYS